MPGFTHCWALSYLEAWPKLAPNQDFKRGKLFSNLKMIFNSLRALAE